ncbi:MAG: hypothetical protein Q8N88_02165 [Nanoarchaeota archaeon]|nr:hypothetical protein [Nanoarchaeota archaeon]
MSISMLRQNIELLNEVSKKYQELINKGSVSISSLELKKIKETLDKFKTYIKFLTANIEQLIKEEQEMLNK